MSYQPHPAATGPSGFAMSTRTLAGTLMGSLVILGFALYFVLAGTGEGLALPEPVWLPAAQLALAAVLHGTITAVGYQVQPLRPGLSAEAAFAQARQRYQATMMVRFALGESLALASIAGAFVISEGGYVLYLVGALLSLVLLWVHVWPSQRLVSRVADLLERDGVRSGLREAFGIRPPGAITEL